ncbi:MAG: alpha/beta hydrolase [Deltaproteobacteria bacterium]|nr:alpha/beta hydrolase [Deltaproteobacteria bacterium]
MRRILLAMATLLVAVIFGPPLASSLFGLGPDVSLRPSPGRLIAIGNDMSINVVEVGTGAPVVLVHGLPSNAYDWAPFTQALAARGYRVIAYDRVGYGYSSRSANTSSRYTLESNAADLRALLDALNLPRVALVGWSYGGGVAQEFASQSPERVSRLVLVASVGPAQPPDDSDALGTILSSPVGGFILNWVGSVPPLARKMTQDALVQAFSRTEAIPKGWNDYARVMLAFPGTMNSFMWEAQRGRYSEMKPEALQVATLILQGTDDRSVPPAVADDLHRRIKGSELVTIPGGCHMLPVVNADVLAERVGNFLAQAHGEAIP